MINLSLTVEQATKLLGRDLCSVCGQPHSVRDMMDIDDNGAQACTPCHSEAAKAERSALRVQ